MIERNESQKSQKNQKSLKNQDLINLFNSVTTMASIGVHVVDLQTREMYFSNEAGFRLINQEPCQYKGRKCYEVFFHSDHPCDNCRLECSKQGIKKHETYVPEADKTFETTTEITTWDGKDVLVEYITDITELKKKQHDLIVSENLYLKRMNRIIQSYPDALGSFVMNLTKDVVTSQRPYYSYIQKQNDNSIADYIEGMKGQIHKLEFEKYKHTFSRQHLIELYNNGQQQISLTHRYQFLDKFRWITSTASILLNPLTKDLEVYVFAVDVTENIVSQQVVQNLISLRYDLLALIYPKEGYVDFRYAGDQFRKIPEISIDQYEKNRHQAAHLFGEKGADQYIKNTEMNTIIQNLDRFRKYSFTMEMNIKGVTKYKRYSYNYLSNDDDIILSTVQDITQIYEKDKKQMEVIQKALEETKKANAAKTDFLSRMSHDMRTPMNGILGMTTLMMDQDLPQEVKENLNQIQMSGKYLLNLINDTLDINKMEANRVDLHPVITDAFKITKNIMANANILATEKGVNLIVEKIKPEKLTHTILFMDESRVEQIFMNLLSNAVKFTPVGGNVRLTYERLETTDDYIMNRYQIIDTGIGMSKEFQTRVFEPFAQEGRIETERESGTGLGLSIVHSLVKLMGGTIEVSSEVDQGTTFTLVLKFDRYKGIVENTIDEQSVDAILKDKRVLLCEDYPLNRKIAIKFLEKMGMLVDIAENGKEGVMRFKQSDEGYYDLILMDIRMPIMDGITATRLIRKLDRKDSAVIPIIAMTANAFDSDVANCLDAGMNDHLAKPLDVQKMYQTIAKYIRKDTDHN